MEPDGVLGTPALNNATLWGIAKQVLNHQVQVPNNCGSAVLHLGCYILLLIKRCARYYSKKCN